MDSQLILVCLISYFALLFVVSMLTSRGANNDTYFRANKSSKWYLVAFGMIGASLSGVTFISVPGWVNNSQFAYMQMVLGYLPGYMLIAFVLMPLYYRLKLTTIYTYLGERFGLVSYKTGSAFFLVSRLLGSALRMFLIVDVLQTLVFNDLNVPFPVTVIGSILLVWLYTFRGGMKTIVWTDTLQTAFMLIAVISTVILIAQHMGWGLGEAVRQISESDYSQVFFWGEGKSNFFKQFLSGALIALCMTGLDQDMMQKNLTCKNIKEAQWNMSSFAVVLVFVNLLFLGLGVMLYLYAAKIGVSETGDQLYAAVVKSGTLPTVVGIFFVLGLTAAAYSSADSAMTALTTSFCYDMLDLEKKPQEQQEKIRRIVHIGFAALTILVILGAKQLDNKNIIDTVFKVASYTYGPLLGFFAFGLFTKRPVTDSWAPAIAITAPLLSYVLASNSKVWFSGFEFGYEILLVNGALTWFGLWLSGFTRSMDPEVS
ncbi:MAG: sodium:solute symporter [Bacteroidetes bacterium]|nr:MAG: sodium:solute symporter [Bacteroidota bacterium]